MQRSLHIWPQPPEGPAPPHPKVLAGTCSLTLWATVGILAASPICRSSQWVFLLPPPGCILPSSHMWSRSQTSHGVVLTQPTASAVHQAATSGPFPHLSQPCWLPFPSWSTPIVSASETWRLLFCLQCLPTAIPWSCFRYHLLKGHS